MASPYVPFRFNPATHTYVEVSTGRLLVSITQMLVADGLVDDRFFTEESCERGTAVHELTADYDFGILKPEECVSLYRPWLLAHVNVMKIERAEWQLIEEGRAHGPMGFAGRCDRAGVMRGGVCVNEIKSGARSNSHEIQTALQAILVAHEFHLDSAPEMIHRYAEYIGDNGRAKLLRHEKRTDFDKARQLIRKYGG